MDQLGHEAAVAELLSKRQPELVAPAVGERSADRLDADLWCRREAARRGAARSQPRPVTGTARALCRAVAEAGRLRRCPAGRRRPDLGLARLPVPVIDGLVAATARHRGLILVTRNVADLALLAAMSVCSVLSTRLAAPS